MPRIRGKKRWKSRRSNFLSRLFVWGNARATLGCTGDSLWKRNGRIRKKTLLSSAEVLRGSGRPQLARRAIRPNRREH
jgi:hypothetical protein